MAVLTLFGQAATGSSLAADNTDYTMGVQFTVSNSVLSATVTGVWFFSPAGALSRPVTIAVFAVTGQALVHSEAATWSGAAGSGWIRAPFTSPPALTLGASYKAAILDNAGDSFYSTTSHYWDTGPGAAGITNGALSAPASAGADGGQDTFTVSAVLAYPATSFNATNYWVDPEVTTVPIPAAPGGGAPDRHHHRTPAGRPGQARIGARGGCR